VSADKSYKLGIGPLSVNARVDRWLDLSKSAGGLAAGLGLTNRQVYTDYEVANKPAAPGGQALPTVFSLRNKFGLVRIAPANSVGSAGSVAPLTGAFSGSMTLSGFGAKTTINGVLLQDDEGTAVGVGLIKIPTSATDFETASIRFLNSVAP
jgi:hypothetical protein